MFLAAAMSWSDAPDRIPVHWNAAGEGDRNGGRFEGLLLVPLGSATIYALRSTSASAKWITGCCERHERGRP